MKKTKKLGVIFVAVLMLSTIFASQAHGNARLNNESRVTASRIVDSYMYLSREMQEREDTAIEIYNQMRRAWGNDSEIYTPEDEMNYPKFYGGAFINEESSLVILVTSLNDDVVRYFERIIDVSQVTFEEVAHSIHDLKSVQESITEIMDLDSDDFFVSNIVSVGLYFPDNAVSVSVLQQGTVVRGGIFEQVFTHMVKNTVSMTADFCNSVEMDSISDIVNIEITDSNIELMTTVSPGNNISGPSVGFWARNAAGQLGIVSTGHFWSEGNHVNIGTTRFGIVERNIFTQSPNDVDASFIRRTNTTFQPTNHVPGHNFNLTRGRAGVSMPIGARAWSRGRVSGARTGLVTSANTNFTARHPTAGNVTIRGVVRTSIGVQNGDSGGIVAGGGTTSERHKAGIITGGTSTTTYHVPACRVVSRLGVTPW
ncbi:MAG: S1 family peptidase [Oscillospiraceae bacterium]|nr:S1 family peptidase [Oscillospiraceae bacterium]